MTGGSQGAESVNQAVIDSLEFIGNSLKGGPASVRFVHQSGQHQVEMITAGYQNSGFVAEVASFFDSFEDNYADADLIISRAGATTVAEVLAAGKAAIMIPYPFAADDHQRRNARAMVDGGAAVMVDPDELSGERLATEIVGLLDDPKRMVIIERNARRMAVLDAESRIADLIEMAANEK